MRMEHRGFKLDVSAHALLIADLTQERLVAEQEYREACLAGGHPALADKAPTTPAQKEALLEALLTSDELARWRRTEKSGAFSTRRSELLRAGHYPPILALVKLSRIDKILTSFGQTLTALVSPATGRIHAHYRVASTASGRASCAGPNLQQIPRDPRFRALFVPAPGYRLHRRRLQLHGVARRRVQIARRRNDGGLRAGARPPQDHRVAHDRKSRSKR